MGGKYCDHDGSDYSDNDDDETSLLTYKCDCNFCRRGEAEERRTKRIRRGREELGRENTGSRLIMGCCCCKLGGFDSQPLLEGGNLEDD